MFLENLEEGKFVCPGEGCYIGGTPVEPITLTDILLFILAIVLLVMIFYVGIKYIKKQLKFKHNQEEPKK